MSTRYRTAEQWAVWAAALLLPAAVTAVLVGSSHQTQRDYVFIYLGLVAVSRRCAIPRLQFNLIIPSVREGFHFATSLTAQTIYDNIDKTMLASLSTLEATGIYGAAYRILEASVVPIASLRQAAYPNFFRIGLHGISGCLPYAKLQAARALVCGVVIGRTTGFR